MNRFLHIIVNQLSKKGVASFKELLVHLPKYTNQYKTYITNSPGHLENLIMEMKETIDEEDIIVIVGGDGSLNLGVTLLEKHQVQNPVGYIPSGSGNDFARAHHLPIEIEASLQHLVNVKKPKELSILYATEGEQEYYAVNSLGIGIDGLVNKLINDNEQKRARSTFSYITVALASFNRLKKFPLTLKVDDGIFTYGNVQLALVVNNAFFGGGLEIFPGASDEDDILEVIIAENANFKDLIQVLFNLFKNKSHLSHPKLHTFKTKQAALFTESEQYGQKDGEVFHQEGFALTYTTRQRVFWI